MSQPSPVFKETYARYLKQIGAIDLPSIQEQLGFSMQGREAVIPLLDQVFRVSSGGIFSEEGKSAGLEICVIVCKYLLLAPDIQAAEIRWTAYRDLKDSGPLTVYWANEVEQKIADRFAADPDELTAAGKMLNGEPPAESFPYDYARQFQLLPRIPALLLFNRKDDEFPASCSVLFDRTVDRYLDAESLGMLGAFLARRLSGFQNR